MIVTIIKTIIKINNDNNFNNNNFNNDPNNNNRKNNTTNNSDNKNYSKRKILRIYNGMETNVNNNSLVKNKIRILNNTIATNAKESNTLFATKANIKTIGTDITRGLDAAYGEKIIGNDISIPIAGRSVAALETSSTPCRSTRARACRLSSAFHTCRTPSAFGA